MMIKHLKIKIGIGLVIVILCGIYLGYSNTPIKLFDDSVGTPNLLINLKNDSQEVIQYTVHVENQDSISGKIDKNQYSKVEMVYLWNASDKLEIVITNLQGEVLCRSKPSLNIVAQHLYNPSIKYEVQGVYLNNQLDVKQTK